MINTNPVIYNPSRTAVISNMHNSHGVVAINNMHSATSNVTMNNDPMVNVLAILLLICCILLILGFILGFYLLIKEKTEDFEDE